MADQKDPGAAAKVEAKSHADVAQSKRADHWQKLANHAAEMINKMHEILNDPYASDADKVEAQETLDAMTKIQFRLQNRYGVVASA